MFVNKSAGAIEHRWMESDAIGELGKSLVDEVEADMSAPVLHARIFAIATGGLARKVQSDLRYLEFAAIGMPGHKGDAFAIQFADSKSIRV